MNRKTGIIYLRGKPVDWSIPKYLTFKDRTPSNETYLMLLNSAANTPIKQEYIKGKLTLHEYLLHEQANLK